MNRAISWLLLTAASLILTACGSGNSDNAPAVAPPPPAAVTMVNGTVVDNFIFSATVTAYAVSSDGVVGACIPSTPVTSPATCAIATSDANGNYSVNLGNYTGAALLEVSGGTYDDTVSGQNNIPVPPSLTLSVLIPAVSPGSTPTVAQITGFTTMAAQLALQQVAQGTGLQAAITSANAEIGNFFYGGLTNWVATKIVDLSQASCPAATDQATADASLLIDGVAELANQYQVTSVSLIEAIYTDLVSDGSIEGTSSGTAIMVPSYGPAGQVALSTIYPNGVRQALWNSITVFEASAANACKAMASTTLQTGLTTASSSPLQNPTYSYTVTGTYTLTGQYLNLPQLQLSMLEPFAQAHPCTGDNQTGTGNGHTTEAVAATLAVGLSQPFSLTIDGTPAINLNTNAPDYNWNDSCGNIQASIGIVPFAGQTCNIAQGPSGSMTFTHTDTDGDINTNAEGINTVIACSIDTEAVTGTVTNLAAGTTLTVTVTDATTASNDSAATATGAGAGALPLNFMLGGQPSNGVQYNDLVAIALSYTQPAGAGAPTQTCTMSGEPDPTAPVTAPITLSVSCFTTGGGGPSTAINNPQGMAYDANGHLWVANNDGSTGSVLEFSVTVNGSNQATALTQIGRITTGINNPTRLAFDAAGNLYVTNLGNNDVTIYETADSSLSQIGTISNGTNRPLGIAVDASTQMSGSGYVYVANNSNNAVTVFSPPAGTLSATNNTFTLVATLSGDGAGNPFSAPGALTFFAEPAQDAALLGINYDVLFVALGPSSGADSVLMYKTLPLQSSTAPFYDLNNGSNCTTGPSGPTAVAVSLDLSNSVHPLLLYVASYYSNAIAAFDVLSIAQNPTVACPTPYATISGNGSNIAQPEGMAVDAFRNVFVSDSSANHITVYNPGSSGSLTLPYAYAFSYSGGT